MSTSFPDQYTVLPLTEIHFNSYTLLPIRYEHRIEIMNWRNEQLEILRQEKKLTPAEQDLYFNNAIRPLFEMEKPPNLLFSLLSNNHFTGYGGLVHINWSEMISEISFLNKTERAQNPETFKDDLFSFLKLIELVAFDYLKLRLIHSYAYNLRPYLYDILEDAGYIRDRNKKIPLKPDTKMHEVIIHYKQNPNIQG